jgi:hypothetical protein
VGCFRPLIENTRLMLWTDNDVTSAIKIRQIDPEVDAVIKSESAKSGVPTILLDGPGSISASAWTECRGKLESALASFNCFFGQSGMQAHLSAVMNYSWYGNGTRARLRLNQIVLSDSYYANSQHPLERWVHYCALALLFQTASNRYWSDAKRGDRYEKKFQFYTDLAAKQWRRVLNVGIPFVLEFLDCPGSLHGWRSGLWDATNLSTSVDGANTNSTATNINLAITYTDASSYISPITKNNAESGPSAVLNYTLPQNTLLAISIATLTPPSPTNIPNTGVSQGIAPQRFPTHWNVYASSAEYDNAPLFLQNASPLPLTTLTFTLAPTLLINTPVMDSGAVPSVGSNLIFGNVVVRG